MNKSVRAIAFATLTLSVLSGILRYLVGIEYSHALTNLHVFLFNLTTGGVLILITSEGRKYIGLTGALYLLGCICFSIGAALNIPLLAIVPAVTLAALVESVRWKKYSWFPVDFFRRVPIARKFAQASLLCLSIGLILCAGTVANNFYFKWFSIAKLDLHVFFLGFSFPISLITFSVIFERIESSENPPKSDLEEFIFWAINVGVILFFLFIITGAYPFQLLMALLLFSSTCIAIYLHIKLPQKDDQWKLLSSALLFLTIGSLTGISFVVVTWKFGYSPQSPVLLLHAALTMFGWNLSWMLLAAREDGHWQGKRIRHIILLHWIFVVLFALGRISALLAVGGMISFLALLYMAFFLPVTLKQAE